MVPCGDCEKKYIGETGRSFSLRIQEHKNKIELLKRVNSDKTKEDLSTSSAIVNHVLKSGHKIDFEKSSLVMTEFGEFRRKIKEALVMKSNQIMENNISWNTLQIFGS
jgi:hypothetical protein